MKTIIFDIDGTITDMWPIEKSVLLAMTVDSFRNKIEKTYLSGVKNTYRIYSKVASRKLSQKEYYKIYNQNFLLLYINNQLPKPIKYPVVDWIKKNATKYHFVYATGGQNQETKYVLDKLKISKFFDLNNSLDKNNCRFSKKTGIPYKKIKQKFPDCLVITDGTDDCHGAIKAKIPFLMIT